MTTRKRERVSLTSKRPYTGKLAARIEVTGVRGPEGQLMMTDEGHQIVKAAIAERYKAVFEMFGIDTADPRKWHQLAQGLFENCVPGAEIVLVEPSKRGRPRKYEGDYSREQFALRVDALVKEGVPRDTALKRAGNEFNAKRGLRSLRNMYSDGRIRWAMLLGSISNSDEDEFLADLLRS